MTYDEADRLSRTLEREARDTQRISDSAKRERAIREVKLLMKHPVAAKLAIAAAHDLRRRLGVTTDFATFPRWLSSREAAVDPCGRPYVLLLANQWPSWGGLRMEVEQDGEIPELPEQVSGVPVFATIQGCFGHKSPGVNGEPCVDPPEPDVQVKASGLGALLEQPMAGGWAVGDWAKNVFAGGLGLGLGWTLGEWMVRRIRSS